MTAMFSRLILILLTLAFLGGCQPAATSTSTPDADEGSSGGESMEATTDDTADHGDESAATEVASPSEQAEVAAPSEDDEALSIGSTAPQLDVANWVSLGHDKFSPVTAFASGKVYVVEFWATWCGPCVRSMPHLVEMQERYADEGVQIISISDEELSTVEGFLNKPYDGGEENGPATYGELTSAYCLTADEDRSAHKDYMEAAGQNGIPTAFIVGKSGLIEWIGHPMTMDEPLAAIVDGSWDREAYAAEFRQQQEMDLLMAKIMGKLQAGATDEAMALIADAKENADGQMLAQLKFIEQRARMMPIFEKMRDADYAGAVTAVDALLADADVADPQGLRALRMRIMMQGGMTDQAIAAWAEIVDGLGPDAVNEQAWMVYSDAARMGGVEPQLLEAVIASTEQAASQEESSAIIDTWAHLVYLQGDLDRAIEIQTRAVELDNDDNLAAFLEQLKQERAEQQAAEEDPVSDDDASAGEPAEEAASEGN